MQPSPRSDRILVGKRTGFAFYRDHRLDRKILIGVFEQNVAAEQLFRRPFDQLPDNFIEGETLREAIIDSDPAVKGKIDRLGYFPKDDTRYAISPYMQYRSESDLLQVHRCATDRQGAGGGLLPLLRDRRRRAAHGRPAACAPRAARQV